MMKPTCTPLLKYLLFIAYCFISTNVMAQLTPPAPLPPDVQALLNEDTSRKIFIATILIQGNKKTKDYIIIREMRFKQGDSVKASLLPALIEQSRSLVYNTQLFTEVAVTPQVTNDALSVSIDVNEKWYLYPTPQFQLVDRNLNEWLKRFNADLNRVVYGVKFVQYNFSGRRDQLRVSLLTGYARTISLSYSSPFSNRALTEGFAISGGYTQFREVNYRTTKNNLISNYTNKGFVRRTFGTSAAYIIRRGFYNSHVISLGYNTIKVDDSVAIKSGNDYFNSAINSAKFVDLSYAFRHLNVDNVNYPLKGRFGAVSLFKRGFGFRGGINLLEINARSAIYFPHGKGWNSSFQLSGKLKAPFDVAYINRRAFGFGDFYLRGLEYYVIDGVATALAQYTLKKKIISFNIPVPFNIKVLSKIPVALFAKTFADAGTSYVPPAFDTRLNNRLLYTAGFGLDILTLYDINLKLEYSFNQLGQNGLFLHMKGGF